jgi:hypothetical protein
MPSEEQLARLQQEKNLFEQLYNLQTEKIAKLRMALVIETDPSRQFQYEQQIQQEEKELKNKSERLDEIEEIFQFALFRGGSLNKRTPPQTELDQEIDILKIKPLLEIAVIGNEASEVEVNYIKLRDLLIAKRFAKADEETAKIMLWMAKREDDGWLKKEDIENYPVRDLLTMDKLWLAASDGKYGFSVQQQIWIDVGGKALKYNKETFKNFIKRVEWEEESKITFDLRGKQGHLPLGLYVKASDNARLHQKWWAAIHKYEQPTIFPYESTIHQPQIELPSMSNRIYSLTVSIGIIILIGILLIWVTDKRLISIWLTGWALIYLVFIFRDKISGMSSSVVSIIKILIHMYYMSLKPHPYFFLLSRRDLLR